MLRAHPLPKIVEGDKETKGRVLIVAGSRKVPGAALLAATAAMRAGAGKLHIVTVDSIAVPVGVAMPEAWSLAWPKSPAVASPPAVNAIAEYANKADAIVAGSGMAEGKTCQPIAKALIECRAQLALDAALLKNLPVPQSRVPRCLSSCRILENSLLCSIAAKTKSCATR